MTFAKTDEDKNSDVMPEDLMAIHVIEHDYVIMIYIYKYIILKYYNLFYNWYTTLFL